MSRPRDAALERQLLELSSLYEIARSLLGAADAARVASRVVLAGLGTFGARSGALFLADDRARYRLVYARGAEGEQGEPLAIESEAREWMLREGAFEIARVQPARLRERLATYHDAEAGAAIADRHGLAGLLVMGHRLMDEPYDVHALSLLDSIAALTAQALGVVRTPDAGERPRRAGGAVARSLAELRRRHPELAALLGDSEALFEACEDIVAVARSRFPVLLTGESGVGKELAARAIHELSDRADGPLEVVDCGSIPHELIESELFGHVKGSFTGAHRDRRGAFELARCGTLFLDEIGEMPLVLQTRLLRVLQEGRFRRVGDESLIDTDVRVIAATNRDLQAAVAAGRFRQDLFYRLNVFAVHLPPLRDRRGDVPLLARHFLAAEHAGLVIEPAVITALESHAWPGNVRELANTCAALAVHASPNGRVTLADLERVWRRQHGGAPPWREAPAATPRGRLGAWVLAQARAHRFNLIEAARRLQREKRAGRDVPISERSALTYYLTGEILEALVAERGDVEAAARAIASDDELVPRAAARVRRVVAALHDGGVAAARRRFTKLPAGYERALDQALRLP